MTFALEPQQLPLSLPFEPALDRDSFIVGQANASALRFIEQWPDWPSPFCLLTGPAGSGKSHLSSIWCDRTGGRLIEARTAGIEVPDRLLADKAIAVDGLAVGRFDEHALFHLLNGAREAGAFVLLTARDDFDMDALNVRDLASRLRGATRIVVGPPDDELLRFVLAKLFADRQLVVDPTVIDTLLVRMERSMSEAQKLVARLDEEALATGRRITRRLAVQVLELASRQLSFTL